jgi:hypothetical protein
VCGVCVCMRVRMRVRVCILEGVWSPASYASLHDGNPGGMAGESGGGGGGESGGVGRLVKVTDSPPVTPWNGIARAFVAPEGPPWVKTRFRLILPLTPLYLQCDAWCGVYSVVWCGVVW